jgi:signal transduction histidine kinase
MTAPGDIDARLGDLLEVLLAIARQDFGVRAAVGGGDDTLDAIAVGLNLLAEELQAEVISRRELERAHSELKEAQARVVHTGKLAAVGQLASGVAHEVNNPATSLEMAVAIIKRAVDDLQAHAGDDAALVRAARAQIGVVRAALDDAQEAMVRIRGLTGDLRTFSRTDQEAAEPVLLDDVASVSCRLAAPTLRPRARLLLDLAPVPPVLGSRGRLGQVLLNLLVNAAQALPEGEAAAPDRQVVAVSTRAERGRVLLTVEDSGPGVPAALRERIFEPFFTTKPEGMGTGLGLALVAEIVAAHQGRIRVDGSPHGGARFALDFPAADGQQAAAPARPAPAPAARARLLLVDDEPTIVRLLTNLLKQTCQVVAAADGAEAVALLEGDRAFDVIFCDLHMPGVDGIAVYEAVGRLQPALQRRFVFTTGGAVTRRSREFLDRVQPPMLAKPFAVEEVLALVQRMTTA